MRYRKLDTNGDYVFGHNGADYLCDVPEAVAQAVATRLRLLKGEWFLDLREGTPYQDKILGKHTRSSYDQAVRERILRTPGCTAITEYESIFEPETRRLTINVRIDTIYGPATINEVL